MPPHASTAAPLCTIPGPITSWHGRYGRLFEYEVDEQLDSDAHPNHHPSAQTAAHTSAHNAHGNACNATDGEQGSGRGIAATNGVKRQRDEPLTTMGNPMSSYRR